ncbi:hypothetical protein WME73_28270 [Sorangium sp. So ce302]|uniref:hypothetical protein n=1 Tax=Sorangium sp. So ce302 TaxID=3133297 RepID=UPI003F631A65
MVADGVFTRADDTGVTFHEERAPSPEEVAGIAARVAKRMTRWRRRRGLVDERPAASEASAPAAQSGPRTRLGTGVTKPVGARIDWASLLRRGYLEDVLACPCGGRRRLVADISEREVIVALLKHLGLPSEAPPIARARSPSCEAA